MSEPISAFNVVRRNFGHWDISLPGIGRIFRIRGGPGKYTCIDERDVKAPNREFKTLTTCMTWICEELMYELIVAEGQNPAIIESWNVGG